jgi:hypothetical protein
MKPFGQWFSDIGEKPSISEKGDTPQELYIKKEIDRIVSTIDTPKTQEINNKIMFSDYASMTKVSEKEVSRDINKRLIPHESRQTIFLDYVAGVYIDFSNLRLSGVTHRELQEILQIGYKQYIIRNSSLIKEKKTVMEDEEQFIRIGSDHE